MADQFNDEIDLLLTPGVLGFYDHIEVIEIFSLSPEKEVGNILTLMIAEEFGPPPPLKEEFLTKELIHISTMKKWGFGIKKYNLTLDELKKRLTLLCEKKSWGDNQKEILKLLQLDKKFVSPNSFELVPLNYILKNNYHNGSYIVEWFDQGKENHHQLLSDPMSLDELSNKINKILPISISPLSDRIGSFILQIPPGILMSEFGLTSFPDDHMLNCKIAWHNKAIPRDLVINCHLSEVDKLCEGYYTKILKSTDSELTFPISSKRDHVGTIWDPENNLILCKTRPSAFISPGGKISSSVSIMGERILPILNDVKKIAISIPDNNFKSPVSHVSLTDWTNERIYESDSKILKERREFVQYNPKGQNKKASKNDAINDLLYLISKHGANAVWLWDPYLSYQDVFSTLLHNHHSKSLMRAISSLEIPPCNNNNSAQQHTVSSQNKIDILEAYKADFNALPNATKKTINLEFRCKTGNNGWSFHDRFLIFPSTYYNQKTLAWSLGTSVNSFGKSHHILQQVTDAQLIANAFIELWNSLSKKECLIWRNTNG
ncbi:hypothetical protein DYG64_18775 [Yersinia enterocolitica]|nr:hypothetical protein [Yersinia enterocolitica]